MERVGMSFLVGMLHSHVTPLADYQPTRQKFLNEEREKAKAKAIAEQSLKNAENYNKSKRDSTIQTYRRVMGADWTHTAILEKELNLKRGSSRATLRKWQDMGIVERRKYLHPSQNGWTRNCGYEWRFID